MQISNRSGMIAGAKLPYDAAVEYLESTGTQWIDTGITTKNAIVGIDCDMMFLSSDHNKWMGYNNYGNNSDRGGFQIGVYTGNMILSYYTSAGTRTLQSFSASGYINKWLHITINALNTGIKMNGYQYKPYNGINFGSLGGIVWLFARNGNLTPANYSAMKARLGAVKLYVGGTTLVRDFEPVRKGNDGYMYDRVSGRLFGSGTTTPLIAGADITT